MCTLSHKEDILANIDPQFQKMDLKEVQYQVIKQELCDGHG